MPFGGESVEDGETAYDFFNGATSPMPFGMSPLRTNTLCKAIIGSPMPFGKESVKDKAPAITPEQVAKSPMPFGDEFVEDWLYRQISP